MLHFQKYFIAGVMFLFLNKLFISVEKNHPFESQSFQV